MKQELRDAYIARIVSELAGVLTGNNFERFGYIIVDHYFHEYEMIHKGTNVAGAPVGNIVDSISSDASVCAEYSSEADYFNNFRKIRKDTRHAYGHYKKSLCKLLLFSNRECPPKKHTRLIQRTARIKNRIGLEVVVWDSRKIAEYIVDEMLFNELEIERLSSFLPCLQQIRNESVLNLLLPSKEGNYLSRDEPEKYLTETLTSGSSVIVSGIGGLGKSSIANCVAHLCRDQFDLVVWLDASELTRVQDLGGWDVHRNGNSVNLLGLAKSRKCLIVLDNLQVPLKSSELESICENGTAILATRRDFHEGDYLLPFFSKDEAKSLLESEVDAVCPDEIFEYLYGLVGGYPLIYVLMNANLLSGDYDWDDIRSDCDAIHEYTDDRNLRLADRLLGHLRETISNEMAFVKSCKSKLIDIELARCAIYPIGIRKLKRAGLLSQSSQDLLKVHDVVYQVLEKQDLPDFDVKSVLISLLLDLKVTNWKLFIRISYRHVELITEQLEAYAEPVLLYSYLIATEPNNVDVKYIPDINDQLVKIMSGESVGAELELLIDVLLESIEVLYRKKRDSGEDGWKEAQEELELRLSIYEKLFELDGITPEKLDVIKHHFGKSLLWVKKDETKAWAKEIFTELSERDRPLREAQLQLARILIKEDTDDAKQHIESILESYGADENAASVSVVLAAFELVSRNEMHKFKSDFNEKYANKIANILKETIAFGYDQSYKALSVFAQDWAFNRPEQFIDVFESISLPSIESLSSDYSKSAVANLLLQAGKVYENKGENKQYAMFKMSQDYFDSMGAKGAFVMRRIGELQCRHKDYPAAIETLSAILGDDAFAHYWLSKSQLNNGDSDSAIISINKGIELLGEGGVRYKASFLDLKSDVLKAMGDQSFKVVLQEAIECSDNEKYRKMLEEKISQ